MAEVIGNIDLTEAEKEIIRVRQPLGGLLQSFKECILSFEDKSLLEKTKNIENDQIVKVCGSKNCDKVNVETIEVIH
jgi:hypothetical protein